MFKHTQTECGSGSYSVTPSLSGAISGALAGARVGSLVPGLGTTTCAIAGGFIGLILGPASDD